MNTPRLEAEGWIAVLIILVLCLIGIYASAVTVIGWLT